MPDLVEGQIQCFHLPICTASYSLHYYRYSLGILYTHEYMWHTYVRDSLWHWYLYFKLVALFGFSYYCNSNWTICHGNVKYYAHTCFMFLCIRVSGTVTFILNSAVIRLLGSFGIGCQRIYTYMNCLLLASVVSVHTAPSHMVCHSDLLSYTYMYLKHT